MARDPYTYEHYNLTLKCGRRDNPSENGFGYLHLYDPSIPGPNHQIEFERLTEGTDFGWEDLVDLAINKATENEALARPGLNWCYRSSVVRYVKATGAYVGTFNFVVIVDPDELSVITTYPGGQC